MERKPRAGEFYRHFKGRLYQVIAVATHTETGEELVIYQALYGDFSLYARPLSMFMSRTDREKYPDALQEYRFERVELNNNDEEGQGIENFPEEQKPQVNPWLERFLEADGYDKQLEALNQMRGKVGQRELDSLYLILDIQPAYGDVEEQLRRIMKDLEMRKRYDGSRLR